MKLVDSIDVLSIVGRSLFMTSEQMCCPGPKQPVVPQQKHCLLIAASNPYRLPSPVLRPPILLLPSGQPELQTEHWWFADAEAVAKAFPPVIISNSLS